MVTVLALLGVLGVLFAAAVLATREEGLLADAPPDAADVPLPDGPMTAEDVGRLRFSLAPRGYRMAQVDQALARLAAELADRDRRIEQLSSAVQEPAHAGAAVPAGAALPTAADVVAATVAGETVAGEAVAGEAVAGEAVAGEADLEPAPEPISTGEPEPEPMVEPETAAEPFRQPAVPDPVPPADLGTEPAAEEQAAQDARIDSPQNPRADTGSQAATSEVAPDTLLAALEDAGERPHKP